MKRNNAIKIIDATELVVGDLLLIKRGDIVRQNGILVQSDDIWVDETNAPTKRGFVNKT